MFQERKKKMNGKSFCLVQFKMKGVKYAMGVRDNTLTMMVSLLDTNAKTRNQNSLVIAKEA